MEELLHLPSQVPSWLDSQGSPCCVVREQQGQTVTLLASRAFPVRTRYKRHNSGKSFLNTYVI